MANSNTQQGYYQCYLPNGSPPVGQASSAEQSAPYGAYASSAGSQLPQQSRPPQSPSSTITNTSSGEESPPPQYNPWNHNITLDVEMSNPTPPIYSTPSSPPTSNGFSTGQGAPFSQPGQPQNRNAYAQWQQQDTNNPPAQGNPAFQTAQGPQDYQQPGQQQGRVDPPPPWPIPAGQYINIQNNFYAPGHTTYYIPMPTTTAPQEWQNNPPAHSSMYL
jgi:hypothetical protein